jgi:hypothetical protein
MIGPTQNPQPAAAPRTQAPPLGRVRNVLTMVPSDRMAGAIPVWGPPRTGEDAVAGALSQADAPRGDSFSGAMAYTGQSNNARGDDEEFGFGDILDMVNPLQHIPIVSRIYRHITGDRIKPVSQVVGDTLYGGPIGGAASLTNVIIAHETGRDIPGNVMALARGEKIKYRSDPADRPEQRLDVAAGEQKPDSGVQDLPGTALAFADLGAGKGGQTYRSFENNADDRAAERLVRTGRPESSATAAAASPRPASPSAFHSLHLNE